VIGNGFSLSIDSGKTVVINPLSLYGWFFNIDHIYK
jgi:hypothetical protein